MPGNLEPPSAATTPLLRFLFAFSYKKTIICQEVAKAKNVCQVCLLDLDYGLPVQVRDKASGLEIDDIPNSDVNKEYMLEMHKQSGELGQQYKQMPKNETLMKMQRMAPFYRRNLAPVCTFFIRGECNRGTECPYRHELPTDTELTEQNIKDRYYGVNDPVAAKLLEKMDNLPKLTPPEDPSITTLYVGGLPEDAGEEDLRDRFYAYGEIESIKVLKDKKCGFVKYVARSDAEGAAEALSMKLSVKGVPCKLMWSKPHVPQRSVVDAVSVPEATSETLYPSMDPSAMGSYLPLKRGTDVAVTSEAKKRKVVGRGGVKMKGTAMPVPKPPPGPPPTAPS